MAGGTFPNFRWNSRRLVSVRDAVTEEPSIWRVAAWLVAKHGDAAAKVAQRHAASPPDQAHEQRVLWMRVTKATLELLRAARREKDPVN